MSTDLWQVGLNTAEIDIMWNMLEQLLRDQMAFIARELLRLTQETTSSDLAGPLVQSLLTQAARDLSDAAFLCTTHES